MCAPCCPTTTITTQYLTTTTGVLLGNTGNKLLSWQQKEMAPPHILHTHTLWNHGIHCPLLFDIYKIIISKNVGEERTQVEEPGCLFEYEAESKLDSIKIPPGCSPPQLQSENLQLHLLSYFTQIQDLRHLQRFQDEQNAQTTATTGQN